MSTAWGSKWARRAGHPQGPVDYRRHPFDCNQPPRHLLQSWTPRLLASTSSGKHVRARGYSVAASCDAVRSEASITRASLIPSTGLTRRWSFAVGRGPLKSYLKRSSTVVKTSSTWPRSLQVAIQYPDPPSASPGDAARASAARFRPKPDRSITNRRPDASMLFSTFIVTFEIAPNPESKSSSRRTYVLKVPGERSPHRAPQQYSP